MKTLYIIQDREAGNYIDSFNTLAEAQKEIKKFERADKQHNAYTSDFYEIIIRQVLTERDKLIFDQVINTNKAFISRLDDIINVLEHKQASLLSNAVARLIQAICELEHFKTTTIK